MSLTTRSSYLDLFTATKLPALRALIFERFNQYPSVGESIFNVYSTDRDIEQTLTMGSVGQHVETDEGSAVSYTSISQGFDKTYVMLKYMLGLKITEEALKDDERGIIRRLSQTLPRSAYDTKETILANHFNNGFDNTYTGPDGLELFSTVHVLEDGGTQKNELSTAADLSLTSLEQAMIDFRDLRDASNKRLRVVPRHLLVPKENMFTAKELLNSTDRPDTAERAINPLKDDNLNLIVWDYLVDTDAFFLLADKMDHELRLYNREPFQTAEDVDFDLSSLKIKSWMRFDSDWSDYRGLFGSPGA